VEYKDVSDNDSKVEENDQLVHQNVFQQVVNLTQEEWEGPIEIPNVCYSLKFEELYHLYF